MPMKLKLALCAGVSAIALAGCNNGHDNNGNTGTPVTQPTALEDNFGAGFGAAYRAGANTEPVDPTAATVIAVDVTKDPVPVP